MIVRLVADEAEELLAMIHETEAHALAHAEQLADLIIEGVDPVKAAALAITLQGQTRLARRLRHARTRIVAG